MFSFVTAPVQDPVCDTRTVMSTPSIQETSLVESDCSIPASSKNSKLLSKQSPTPDQPMYSDRASNSSIDGESKLAQDQFL